MELQDPNLRQRGRASLDFLAQMGVAAAPVSQKVTSEISDQMDPDKLPDDLDERDALINAALADSRAFATHRLMGDWHSRSYTRISTEAFEEILPELQPVLDKTSNGPASLELDPDLPLPDYWDGVHFHRTDGGWDGHEHMGYVHGEIIHKKMVARFFPGGIFQQRQNVAEMAPRDNYKRILDMGCSSGHFTTALANTYPDAQITGVELSARMLEHAFRTANANGWNWKLYQRPAEDTGFDDASFDLVASYILIHEIPADVVEKVFAEAFRLLEPGGDMIMSDATRYADLDKLGVWKADRGAKYGGEPFWRETASLDLAEIARKVGFEDVSADGIYPHVVKGRKPA
ncbi:Methyltransferase domain-containing protein [Parasphingorhabdus marina DSM 22363]|uniref:Methyltransferase domain-containing protein n=1 Tax=Parasphingorhabdus marina DSM 22363 TaxID=1123272 RepID=A0A1N6D043_9SPHN|nr:class I SAM-dependent methyltransferase [Parasphingorhabdus marina]SIN64087.1 Methyltransferase domain-containing protein [Parasphingorhabdus marina DSM 22363]